jgi:adenylate cyclase
MVIGLDVALTAALADRNPLSTIELKTYDWRLTRTARPSTARSDIALVEIDEYSLRNLEPQTGRWPWPRLVHSMIIDFLARGPARVIAYDVVFAGADSRKEFEAAGATWTGEESDKALADSIRTAGTVLLPVDATYEGSSADGARAIKGMDFSLDSSRVIERKVVFPPFEVLGDAAAGLGHNLFVFDADGPLRHTVPFVRHESAVIPSLGLAAALRAARIAPADVHIEGDTLRAADRSIPLELRHVRNSERRETYQWGLVNFRGPALLDDLTHRPYVSFRAFDLLDSENNLLNGQKPAIDPSVFKDKIVFVGATATALFDAFETPFAQASMPGMQVHAGVADDLLSNRFLKKGGTGGRVAAVFLLAVVVGLIATAIPAWWAALAAVAVLGVFAWIATSLFAGGYWLNLTQPVLAFSTALFGGVAYQYFVEGREKRKMKRLFGQYVSKDVYEQLVANPELAKLGGQRREMTVLFSDIRGFTTVTERGQPEEIVGMLNEYFTKMVEIVFRHKGTIDKFVGDMVMALFGAPLDDPRHADHAVDAALDMIDELGRLNTRWKEQGRFAELDIGIGVNTGPMIAGNIGSEAIMSYTVIGDAVNLGARLESLNKQYGTRIIVSEATREQLTGRYVYRPLGEVVVKGKTKPVAIFEVTGRGEAATEGVDRRDSPAREARA